LAGGRRAHVLRCVHAQCVHVLAHVCAVCASVRQCACVCARVRLDLGFVCLFVCSFICCGGEHAQVQPAHTFFPITHGSVNSCPCPQHTCKDRPGGAPARAHTSLQGRECPLWTPLRAACRPQLPPCASRSCSLGQRLCRENMRTACELWASLCACVRAGMFVCKGIGRSLSNLC